MSSLPIKPIARDTVTIGKTPVEIRGLSRREAMHFQVGFSPEAMPDVSLEDRMLAAELYVLQQGTGATEDEARAFCDSNDTDTVGLVLDRILEISGMVKPGKKGKGDPSPNL